MFFREHLKYFKRSVLAVVLVTGTAFYTGCAENSHTGSNDHSSENVLSFDNATNLSSSEISDFYSSTNSISSSADHSNSSNNSSNGNSSSGETGSSNMVDRSSLSNSSSSRESLPVITPSAPVLDFSATDLLGKTIDEAAEMFGHLPSDYMVDQDTDNWNVMFQADPDIELYSLVGYTYGKIRCVGITSNRIKLSSGYGSIDNVCIGMSEDEFLETVSDMKPESYGVRGLYMMTYLDVDFTVLLDGNNLVTYLEADNSNITF